MADNIWLCLLQMVNVSSIFAGMLRAGLPALAQHLISLMDQPEENPMVRTASSRTSSSTWALCISSCNALPCITPTMLEITA